MSSQIENDNKVYIRHLKDIKKIYKDTKSWDSVFYKAVYLDEYDSQEAFIDYVEEVFKTKVKDAKHLQTLIGLKDEDITVFEDVIISSNYNRYFNTLKVALEKGIKYKELLEIEPKDFGLPEKWSKTLSTDKYSSELWAISLSYLLDEPASLMLLPSIRKIAEVIEAPYSVIMDAYDVSNRTYTSIKYKAQTVRNEVKKIEEIITLKLEEIILNESTEWREENDLPEPPLTYEDIGYEMYINATVLMISRIGVGIAQRKSKTGSLKKHLKMDTEVVKWMKTNFKEEIKTISELVYAPEMKVG